jgi:hypothetical protein
MIRVVYPGSGFFPIPDPVVKKPMNFCSGSATPMQCMRALKDNSASIFRCGYASGFLLCYFNVHTVCNSCSAGAALGLLHPLPLSFFW